MPALPPTAIRPARGADATAVADLWLRSRRSSQPAIPAPIHTDDEVRAWFATIVLPAGQTWVAERLAPPGVADPPPILALLVLDDAWIDQLYVEPRWFGRGVGSALVGRAKLERPGGLDLWTFQANRGARRFYERHGFVAITETDGDNEEGAPDIGYRWRPA